RGPRARREPRPSDFPFLAVSPGASPQELTRALLERYDRDRNRRLTRAEIGLDAATFKQLDANGNGELDANELAKFLQRTPDLEVLVRLGRPAPRQPAGLSFGGVFIPLPRTVEADHSLTVLSGDGQAAPLARAVRQVGRDELTLTL